MPPKSSKSKLTLPVPNMAMGIAPQTVLQWQGYVSARLQAGLPLAALLSEMAEAGAPPQEAYGVLWQELAKLRKQAARTMAIGGVVLLFAIGITALTYEAASSTGGDYYVAWGLMLGGGFFFIKGMIGWLRLPSL